MEQPHQKRNLRVSRVLVCSSSVMVAIFSEVRDSSHSRSKSGWAATRAYLSSVSRKARPGRCSDWS